MPYIESHYGAYIVHGRFHGPKGTLYQTDWDYPSLASEFGWSLTRVQKDAKGNVRYLARRPSRGQYCPHRSTDGTVNCPDCGVTASQFIGAAGEYLANIAT